MAIQCDILMLLTLADSILRVDLFGRWLGGEAFDPWGYSPPHNCNSDSIILFCSTQNYNSIFNQKYGREGWWGVVGEGGYG